MLSITAITSSFCIQLPQLQVTPPTPITSSPLHPATNITQNFILSAYDNDSVLTSHTTWGKMEIDVGPLIFRHY